MTVKRIWLLAFANDNDAFIPEVWAAESLMILFNNVVAAQLVHTDFSAEIAQSGDVVNTRRPAKFVSKRKTDSDSVTTQDATSENVPVKLDQHHHVSFVIKDGEESKGMVSLVNTYLRPAVEAIAQAIDEVVVGQKYEFLANAVGRLDQTITKSTVIAAATKLDSLSAPQNSRNLIVSANAYGDLQNISEFMNADKIGDDGSAMREGSLGRKFGFQTHMSQNNKPVTTGTTVTGAVNSSGGHAAGTTSITVDGFSAAITAGSWITVDGDGVPQLVTGTTGGATPTVIAVTPGLKRAVANDAVVTVYTPGALNYSPSYAIGYAKELAVDGITVAPTAGRMISSGTAASALQQYSALSTPTTTAILLNRPLDASIANDAVVGLGPKGDYGFAFHRNAIALVSRPLAQPMEGTGARAAVIEDRGIGIRVVVTYDGEAQGHRVTVDLLCGVKTLDTNLGVPVLSQVTEV